MRYAVLGDPIAHSLSPALHRAGYAHLGLDHTYEAVRVPAGTLAAFLAPLAPDWGGLSLTMPLKREAMPLAVSVSPVAALAGAANTLVRGPDGWDGHNTDVPGTVAALGAHGVTSVPRAAIWGGGATASSVLLALADLGCGSVDLHVRSPSTADPTVAVAAAVGLPVSVRTLADPVTAPVLVSTVPAQAQQPLVSSLGDVEAVFEVVYDPWPTPLAAWALAREVALVTGLDLLVHQAVLQFSLFTGHSLPASVMYAALPQANAK